jgi:hypothetical protein
MSDNAQPQEEQIKCPDCGSTKWRCWDERTEWFEDKETGELFEYPVGYLACIDCGRGYTHHDVEDAIWLGDYNEAFGEDRW